MEHYIEPGLLNRQVNVHLIGVGGNGAQMASRLGRLDVAIRALGHPHGLKVTAFDPGRVRESNIGRQAFSRADVGANKSVLTISRLNNWFGVNWDGFPWSIQQEWDKRSLAFLPDIVISCVDTRAARRDLHHYMIAHRFNGYWLDLGNDQNSGQAVLGQPGREWPRPGRNKVRLPTVADLYPELLDESVPDSNAPSCSIAISLASQGLYVNDTVANFAAQLLYQLFERGSLRHHGVIFNLDNLRSAPIDVDPAMWARLGVELPADLRTPEPVAA